MKILHISLEPPSERSGGGLVVRQTARSMEGCSVDYVGPQFGNSVDVAYSKIKFLKAEKSQLLKLILSLLKVSLSPYTRSFSKAAAELRWSEYDIVLIENSRHGYVTKVAKKNNATVVVRVHNVEKDYLKQSYKAATLIQSLIARLIGGCGERASARLADAFCFLTEEDKTRFQQIYGIKSRPVSVVPVCLEDKGEATSLPRNSETVRLLMTGSFWYGPNSEGAEWFLEHVWPLLLDEAANKFELVLAGSRPTESLVRKVSATESVRLFATPTEHEMSEKFREADLYVAPILNGAGMKVKVAEALSYGKPVVASPHAAVGYGEAVDRGCVVVAPTALDFVDQIWAFARDDVGRNGAHAAPYDCFQEEYSEERSRREMRSFISAVAATAGGVRR